MRKASRVGAAAVGALTAALLAGAFAYIPASKASTATAGPSGPPVSAAARKVLGPAVFASSSTVAPGSVQTVQNPFFAGYAAGFGTTTFRLVTAHFTAPYMDCTGIKSTTLPNGAWSSDFIGLSGEEVTGIDVWCNGTTPTYAPWWQVASLYGRPTSLTVHPGNSITMTVYYNKNTHQFTMTFSDITTGQKWSRTKSCPSGITCYRGMATALTEGVPNPSSAYDALLPLADYQAVGFDDVRLINTSGTHRGGLQSSYWHTARFTMAADTDDGTSTGNPLNFDFNDNPIPNGTLLAKSTQLYQKDTFLTYWMPANAG